LTDGNAERNRQDIRIGYLEELYRSQMFALDLLTSLGGLQADAAQYRDARYIFERTFKYLKKMIALDVLAIYTVDEIDSDFNLTLCTPNSKRTVIEDEVSHAVDQRDFAWALNQNRPVVVKAKSPGCRLVLHVLASKLRVRGMFVGLLPDKGRSTEKQKLQILSIIIHYTANAFESNALYKLLTDQNRVLEENVRRLNHEAAQRKIAENKQKKYAVELQRSNKELQDFAYIASHDLREPLRKIVAFGERLKHLDSRKSPKAEDYLSRMHNAAVRMDTLINDLLQLSRITTQAQPFRAVELKSVIAEVLEDLEIHMERTRGKINVNSLPTLEADRSQMRQLFQNLIANALKFHREGVAPVVDLSSRRMDDGCWEIIVEDNGIGLDPKYAERIFKPFERLHGRSDYEGTGLGLAICRKIATRHEGTIAAKSAAGTGTTISIVLPEKQAKRE